MKEKRHLPLFGVGPAIIAFQVLITLIGMIVSHHGYFDAGTLDGMNPLYESDAIRVVEFENPLTIAINGRKGTGIVKLPE